ncbi:M20/M25/M40 family metallo-hydrolase [Archangium violaceum]|uniref:M20/M25/M40 family metallo-hydrolase n=1 Tax=Archangium violaceum TaxID=83451 RepID=UPI00193B3D84|nr:M20/M25/M40 family metallo-hydrolase [Archangium violaceum]QRK09712.1 M20/M25/M40 family metallo-hydrolase [Archangium violaceum]
MGTRKFGPIAVWLVCSTPAFAEAPQQDKDVWITIGTDALPTVRASFKAQGVALSASLREKGGVAALRIRESQIDKLAGVMHDKLHRCAGFVAHDSEEKALAEVESASAPPQALAAAISYNINNGPSVNAMMAGVQEINIRNTINSLSTNWTSRRYNLQSGIDAATWLKDQWTTIANGRTDVTVAFHAHPSSVSPQPSVIATIKGTTLPDEVVVIGGHLDSINTNGSSYAAPGADDDASGVASLTEAFRVAMASGYKPARTVKFMAYAAEEIGLKGSADIANQHKSSMANVVGVLQLDMTNYKGSTYDFGMVTDNTNESLTSFTTSLITTYLPGMTYTRFTCGYGCSDHASWNSAGYPAVMPFEGTLSSDNPNIHTSSDTLSVTSGNANNSVKFAKLAAAFLGEVAKGATTGNTPPPTGGGSDGGGGGGTINTATYDATLKAPKCAAAGAGCDSGTLLNGRGGVGPETNKPNTINGTCTDGTSGSYHSDESNDRLKVTTTDGTNLAAGKQVKVEATVWAYSTTADTLDLYYSASASNPSWKLIGSYKPGSKGATTISATYTLPTGSLQAIRANFRYNGSASTCSTGSYDDRDDLIFTVQ